MFEYCTPFPWTPTIGDPTFIGWFTVVAYAIATVLSAIVFARSDRLFKYHYYADLVIRKQRLFWLVLTLVLAFLCVNKQLDLQSLFTAVGRCVAKSQGWYDTRRKIQVEFIIAIGVGGLLAVVLLSLYFRRILKDAWLAIVGFCVLVSFVVIRAASFHHVDMFLGAKFLGAKMNWILELSGIFFICIACLVLLYRYRSSRPEVTRRKDG